MALDDYSFDIDTWVDWTSEKSDKISEVSEKFKESIKKWSSWIWRTKKDEKKAKKYDFLLANFLVKIIINKRYDSILENIFKIMDFWYNSNFVLGILSIINLEVSDKIREISWKEKVDFDYYSKEKIEFDDVHIDKKIKKRINLWIEDMIDSVTIDFSNIQNKKNLETLKKDNKIIIIFIAQIFSFFLNELNISIKKDKAIWISDFITSELKKSLEKLDIKEI